MVEVVNGERSFRDLDQKAVEHVIHAVDVANGHRGHGLPLSLNSKQTTCRKLVLTYEHLHLARYIRPIEMFDGIAFEVESHRAIRCASCPDRQVGEVAPAPRLDVLRNMVGGGRESKKDRLLSKLSMLTTESGWPTENGQNPKILAR